MKKLTRELKVVVDAIQDKKGRRIRVVDLRKTGYSLTNYMVICEGGTPNQVSAITRSVGDKMRETLREYPLAVDGTRNNLWVAMDYADVIVHIFVPDCREFYDIDNLWEDAAHMDVPDVDAVAPDMVSD